MSQAVTKVDRKFVVMHQTRGERFSSANCFHVNYLYNCKVTILLGGVKLHKTQSCKPILPFSSYVTTRSQVEKSFYAVYLRLPSRIANYSSSLCCNSSKKDCTSSSTGCTPSTKASFKTNFASFPFSIHHQFT